MATTAYDIIKRPIITEQSMAETEHKKYTFEVAKDANKIEIAKAVVVTPEVNDNVIKSARNIPGVVTTTAKILSVYDIVNAGKFIVDKAALAVIEEVFA